MLLCQVSHFVPLRADGQSPFLLADMEDYGFEYSDEEQEEQDVDIENQYYNSKGACRAPSSGSAASSESVTCSFHVAPPRR